MSSFRVSLQKVVDDSYSVEIGFGLQETLVRDLRDGLLGGVRHLAVLTDETVEPLYAERIRALLEEAGFHALLFSFPAGEASKTRETKALLEDRMLEANLRRDCAVVNVGGGVVSDLGGFLAGTYARGVPFVNYATTLLSAADASVGGKTAVDTARATNLIGLFNQPKKVYVDVAAWKTLPSRQISSGLAETVKHGCLGSAVFFSWLEENMDRLRRVEPEACLHIAEENCRIKYAVVMQDEQEHGMREILNLGHTVGRALETVSGYRLLHGEAVSVGLMAQAGLARRRGLLSAEEEARVRRLLLAAELPVEIPPFVDREALMRKLYTDKKVRDGRLRFVLQKGIGAMEEFSPGVYSVEIPEDEVREVVAAL